MIQDESQAVQAEAQQEPASRWEDYIDIFFSPAELYARRAKDRVGPPLITLLLLGTAIYYVFMSAARMVMLASAPDEQSARAMEQMGGAVQVVLGLLTPIMYLVVLASAAFLLWLVGRFAEMRTEFSRTMLIVTYAGFVYLLGQLAVSIGILLHGEAGLDVIRHTSFGPLRFIGHADMNPVALGLLRRFDIFAIWQAVLWGIGLAVIYRASRAQAAITAATAWLLFAIPGIIGAALTAMRG